MSTRDIIRQKIWSLIGDVAIHAYAYTINPAKHRWVMGKEMFELLSEGKGMLSLIRVQEVGQLCSLRPIWAVRHTVSRSKRISMPPPVAKF
jgi:hypothetical protein